MASNAVNKVELANVKIDLASIKDLDDAFKLAQLSIQNANGLVAQDLGAISNKWQVAWGKLKNEMKIYEQNKEKTSGIIDDINAQLKQLGITDTSSIDKYKGYLEGLRKTASALRMAALDNKNRMDTIL